MISNIKVYVDGRRKFNWFWKRWKVCPDKEHLEFSRSFNNFIYKKDVRITFDSISDIDDSIKKYVCGKSGENE